MDGRESLHVARQFLDDHVTEHLLYIHVGRDMRTEIVGKPIGSANVVKGVVVKAACPSVGIGIQGRERGLVPPWCSLGCTVTSVSHQPIMQLGGSVAEDSCVTALQNATPSTLAEFVSIMLDGRQWYREDLAPVTCHNQPSAWEPEESRAVRGDFLGVHKQRALHVRLAYPFSVRARRLVVVYS